MTSIDWDDIDARTEALAGAEPPTDRLEAIRDVVRQRRDLDREKIDAEERLTGINVRIRAIEHEELPAMFADARISGLDIPADGNKPACTAALSDYFHANIVAAWPVERREAGYAALDAAGLGDIVKTEVVVTFGRGEDAARRDFVATLGELGVACQQRRAVAWATLTAAVRDLYQRGQRLSGDVLDAIGAQVGHIVRIKPTS